MHCDAYVGILSNSDQIAALSSQKWATPLGQVVIATAMERRGVPSRVYNLDVTSWETVRLDAEKFLSGKKRPVVGLTLITGNVSRSLWLSQWFKENYGAIVIVGGPEVTEVTAQYYSSFSFIDGAVVGVATDSVFEAMKDGWGNKKIINSSDIEFNFSTPVNYRLIFRLKEDHGGVSYAWGGDCLLRNHRCYFCSRSRRGFGFRDPEQVWADLTYPLQIGKKYFYNTADTVATNIDAFTALVRSRPIAFKHTYHKTFINAMQVNEQTVPLLHDLNAYAAVGIESFGNLEAAGKGATTGDHNRRAIELCYQGHIPMILTFVFGLPGETAESLRINEEEIVSIARRYGSGIHMITVSPLLISIGSRAFDDVATNVGIARSHLGNAAYYDPLGMSSQYYQTNTGVTREGIIASIKRIHDAVGEVAPRIAIDSKGISPQEKESIQSR